MVEEGLVDGPQIFQVGVRGFVRDNGMDFANESGINVFSVDKLRELDCALTALGINLEKPCYISFDIDAVDPAYAPGTGTPVPGGLTSSEALTLLTQAMVMPLVGADIVEVAPVYDSSEITVLLAAHMTMELLVGAKFVTSPEKAQHQ